jgi:hypothetical protein
MVDGEIVADETVEKRRNYLLMGLEIHLILSARPLMHLQNFKNSKPFPKQPFSHLSIPCGV